MKLTLDLTPEQSRHLLDLAEIYHTTPEHMATVWVVDHIDRLVSGLSSTDGADPQP